MNISKHTPGPWDLVHWDKKRPDERTIVSNAIEDHVFSINMQSGLPDEYRERDLANLKLMAAAPELLEAIESYLEYQDKNQRFDPVIKIREIDVIKLKKAVNKARGIK
jgi:hypothetical protein